MFGGLYGYETASINGQLVPVAPGQAFSPLTFGAEYTGPGFWPRNGVYNTPPVSPSPSNAGNTTVGAAGGTGGASLSAAGTPMPSTGAQSVSGGGANFFHLTKSPLVWALLFLVGGVLMLQHVHYK
jgi:hypothetical protein